MKKTKTYPQIGEVVYDQRPQKHIRLSCRQNQLRLSYPLGVSFRQAEQFVLARTDWILNHRPATIAFSDGLLIGRHHRLSLSPQHTQTTIVDGIIYGHPEDLSSLQQAIKAALKIEAQQQLLPRLTRLEGRTGLRAKRYRIRYMTSRWGSCSSQQSISLNSAAVYLPTDLIDYVIIHELCHLRFLNHSPAFWRLVDRHLPGVQGYRQQLRQYQIGLIVSQHSPTTETIN